MGRSDGNEFEKAIRLVYLNGKAKPQTNIGYWAWRTYWRWMQK